MSKSIAATAAIAVVLLIGAPAKQAGAIGGRTCDEHCRRLWALGLPLASSLGRRRRYWWGASGWGWGGPGWGWRGPGWGWRDAQWGWRRGWW